MFLLTSDRDRCHGRLALGSAAFVSSMMELSTDPTLTGRHSMFSKGKTNTVPSDAQAREKLALYVYEYLLHVGAQKSAQTFLSEIRWEKNITLGEPPGFLHSWWCVFWDLYCASPERRESYDHSSEAKAFHDYVIPNLPPGAVPSPPFPQMTNENSGNLAGMPGYFPPNSSQGPQGPSPHHGGPTPPGFMPGQPNAPFIPGPGPQNFIPQRYQSRSSVRIPGQPVGVPGVPGAQPLLPNTMDPNRSQPSFGGPPMSVQRMAPRMQVGYSSMRPNAPVGPPMSLPGGRAWNPTTSAGGNGPPGTPMMPSTPDTPTQAADMYNMMKSVPGASSMTPFGMPGGPEPGLGIDSQQDIDGLPKEPPNDHGPGTPGGESNEFGGILSFNQDGGFPS
ncbi:single-stranded DNA-binding protein 3-like isoform X2 [Dendronephthya gigantea]|uniref:single-stranded DNA-binding protein 3-like isoform X2 n=1 Tax=Dendronephthya gigantea TaxID=151771 RepID=UPI00106B58D7|nr:single-stranded DNA-binding protein 3-like isoform X2 [Dendronephthya gigantea]